MKIRFTLLLFLFYLPLFCQHYTTQFNAYNVEDGLSHRFVNAIAQDEDGFIWIGTNYGLNRFDGYEFKVYPLVNVITEELPISNIQFDEKGRLWLRFNRNIGNSINVFDPKTNELMTVGKAMGIKLSKKLETQTFAIPLSSGRALLYETDTDSIHIINKTGIKSVAIGRVKKDLIDGVQEFSPDRIVVNTMRSVDKVCRVLVLNGKGDVLEEYTIPSPNVVILNHKADSTWVLAKRDNSIYKCYAGIAPEKLSYKTDSAVMVPTRINKQTEHYIFTNPQNSKKIEERDYQGKLLREISLESINKFNSFDINTTYIDRDAAIWFSDFNYLTLGYLKVQKNHFQRYLHDYRTEKKVLQSTRGITIFKDSLLLINTAEDCFSINLKTNELKALEFPKDNNGYSFLSSLLIDGDCIWTISPNGQLYKYHLPSQKMTTYACLNKERVTNKRIQLISVFKDKDSILWIGTMRGLYCFDREKELVLPFNDYHSSAVLAASGIYYFYENKSGIWLCTTTGLYLLNKATKSIVRYHDKGEGDKFIPYNHIAHLHEDKEGLFWLATKGGGLIKWNPQTSAYEQFTTKEGLSHNIIYAVYEDEQGSLWMSSDRGIMQFFKENQIIINYLPRDGVSHEECNTFSHYQAKDGTIYFGGLNGVSAFHPRDFMPNPHKNAKFLITSFETKKNNDARYIDKTQSLLSTRKITIHANENAFILKFALLDYTSPKQNRYAYKIEGIEKDWIYTNRPVLQINQLPYGNYTLTLKAQGANGHWVYLEQSIAIEVLRPFYLSFWFILLSIVLFCGLVFWFIQLRVAHLETRKKELEQIVYDRTLTIQEQAEELKVLDEAKSRFFANVSHELRTPLTLILGPISHILDSSNTVWEPSILRKQLLTMQRNGKSLLQMVEEILDLSKLEQKALEIVEEPVLLENFFAVTFQAFEHQFENLGLSATLEIDQNLQNLSILIDKAKMEKVVNNYLGNAIKFTPTGGAIKLSVYEEEAQLVLSVKDSGKGIAPIDLPHVFERFYQTKLEKLAPEGGAGIGLALVKEYATLFAGDIFVESQLGIGSTFYFRWPKKIAEYNTVNLLSDPKEAFLGNEIIYSIGQEFTILVVEDNLDMRNFIATLLENHYKVMLAKNGLEGLRLLEQDPTKIQLILSDVMMPEMDGFTMLKRIKSNEQLRSIPVIILTALTSEKDKLNALTIAVNDYLTKPFSPNELLVRIQNLLYNYHQRLHWQESVAEEVILDQGDNNSKDREEDLPVSEADQNWVKEIEEKVLALMQNEIPSAEELAQLFFLSQRQFARRLKKITGLTPAKFIREVQLQKARTILETGKAVSVTETAYTCGFEVTDTFSRLYKQRYGKNPSEYL